VAPEVIAIISMLTGVGQLVVAVVALREPGSGSRRDGGGSHGDLEDKRLSTSGMAKDRIALDSALIAAVMLVLASVALLVLEDSNAKDQLFTRWIESQGFDANARPEERPSPPRILDEEIELIFVLIGISMSVVGMAFGRRAWKRWLDASDTLGGVVFGLALTVLSGVVGLLFLTDLSAYVFAPGT
jgi:hypothetical protein